MSGPPVALTIAGSDPTGGAGLQLDLQVFAHHGVHGMAVPTALTVQTRAKVHRTLPVFPNVIGEQITYAVADVRPSVVKIGMLATDDVVLRVASALERWQLPRVVDPVLRASDGAYLLERRGWSSLCERLIAGATLVAPNLDEAEYLTGERDAERAAAAFMEMGAGAVLITGGHADGPPDDLLATADERTWLRGERHDVDAHGTGCALTSAIAARLARGDALRDAVRGAKSFVAEAIARAHDPGDGRALLRLASAD